MRRRFAYSLIAFFLLAFFLFLPALFEPLQYGDECIYLAIGNALRHGAVLYRDIHDNKPPIIYLLAALSFGHLYLFRFFALLANLSFLSLLYLLIRRLLREEVLARWALWLALPLMLIFEARVANGEVFMMPPLLGGFYLLWSWRQQLNFRRGFLVGVFFSLGFLVKVPVAFDILGISLAIFIFLAKKPFAFLRQDGFWGLVIGFLGPIILSLLYFAIVGGFTPYLRSALLQNVGYLSSWAGSSHDLYRRALLLFFLVLPLWFFRRRWQSLTILGLSWFFFSLFGALLSGRPYPHYLFEVIPSWLLLILLLGRNFKRRYGEEILTIFLAILLLPLAFFRFHFWWYPQLKYYRNFLNYFRGHQGRQAYFQFWGRRCRQNYRLANFIRQTVPPGQPIFVWGDAACVYALSDRLPVGRYLVNYHLYDYHGFAETLRALQRKKPLLIIELANESRRWPALEQLLARDYYRLYYPGLVDMIYHRRPPGWPRGKI